MPVKAILRDIHDLKLDPKKPIRNTDKSGRLLESKQQPVQIKNALQMISDDSVVLSKQTDDTDEHTVESTEQVAIFESEKVEKSTDFNNKFDKKNKKFRK